MIFTLTIDTDRSSALRAADSPALEISLLLEQVAHQVAETDPSNTTYSIRDDDERVGSWKLSEE